MQQIKKHHAFPIQTVIHPDRFLYKNKAEVEQLRQRVVVIQKKISYLEECLARYTNFNDSKLELNTLFNQMLHFFAQQGKEQPIETTLSPADLSDLQLFTPLQQPKMD